MKEMTSTKEGKMMMKPTTKKEERRGRIMCHPYLSFQASDKFLGSFRSSCVYYSGWFLSESDEYSSFSYKKLTLIRHKKKEKKINT